MNFDFSDEQKELRRQAQRVLGTGPRSARSQLGSMAPYDGELWRQVTELGWTAVAIGEESGGFGCGPLELCVLAEECGRVLAPIPFESSVLQATEALRIAQSFYPGDSVPGEWLPKLATGEVVGTLALVEPNGRMWGEHPIARVSEGALTGVKSPVSHARGADVAIVSACSEEDGPDEFSLWLVDLRRDNISRHDVCALDLVTPYGELHFDRAAAQRIGPPASGRRILDRLINAVAVFTAFEQLGSAEGVMDLTLNYVRMRKAFGREVASYQAVKHKLADMYVKIELARSHAYFGAWALNSGDSALATAAAGARLAALDAFRFASEESVELHGGIGFTWECDVQLYYRHSRAQAIGLGGRQHWSRLLTNHLSGASTLKQAEKII